MATVQHVVVVDLFTLTNKHTHSLVFIHCLMQLQLQLRGSIPVPNSSWVVNKINKQQTTTTTTKIDNDLTTIKLSRYSLFLFPPSPISPLSLPLPLSLSIALASSLFCSVLCNISIRNPENVVQWLFNFPKLHEKLGKYAMKNICNCATAFDEWLAEEVG